jgi:glutamyl/glutaminyl-tRNA synthetase
VFRTLDWLDVHVDAGPAGPADFLASWSMSARIDQFRAARDSLLGSADGSVFVCRCSRRELGPAGHCTRGCRGRNLPLEPGRSVLRLSVPAPTPSTAGTGSPSDEPPAPPAPIGDAPPGDHVLWRRDDLPAYHLGSVVVDEELEVNSIIRGIDLKPSSALQRRLAALLPAPGFVDADIRHHDLLASPSGAKLSKSAGAQAHPLEHTVRLRDQVWAWAEALGAPIGIGPP